MRVFETVLVAIFAALGVRSFVYWSRRPLEGTVFSHHVAFALFLTGRIGFWFSLAGIFLVSALSDVGGRAFTDDMAEFRWMMAVPISLAALQLVAGVFLGRTSSRQ
ncbi:MAG: hypothetical protein WD757_09170 [Actinomycetota bacterium]